MAFRGAQCHAQACEFGPTVAAGPGGTADRVVDQDRRSLETGVLGAMGHADIREAATRRVALGDQARIATGDQGGQRGRAGQVIRRRLGVGGVPGRDLDRRRHRRLGATARGHDQQAGHEKRGRGNEQKGGGREIDGGEAHAANRPVPRRREAQSIVTF